MTKLALTTIISGGQTGADQAGLRVGRALGLYTGGCVPKGCRTDAGPMPELVTVYGCLEHHSQQYAPRTILNVRRADMTIWFGRTDSPGYRCTYGAVRRETYRRPYEWLENPDPQELRDVLTRPPSRDHPQVVRVLNVAGNRERTSPDIATLVEYVLTRALTGLVVPVVVLAGSPVPAPP